MGDLARAIGEAFLRDAERSSPKPRESDKLRAFPTDPVGFAREVLGVRLWKRQRELLESAAKNPRVSAVSGQKIGKTTALVCLALWHYCSFPAARTFVTAPTEHQLNGAFWRELKRIVAAAKVPIPGGRDIHLSARGGLKDHATFSEITGLLGRDVEALQGMSGEHLLFIVDEASGVDDLLIEAIKGNQMGGARMVMIGNPTRTHGEFYSAFTNRKQFYTTLEISALETPNCTGEEEPIPGLATRETCARYLEEYGKDSAFYRVRVLGQFVVGEEGKIISLAAIARAEALWNAAGVQGVLQLGVDPAGPGDGGDETAIAVRRGNQIDRVLTWRGLNEEGIIAQLVGVMNDARAPKEIPIVVVDSLGAIGASLYGRLRALAERERFTLIGVRSSDKAGRQPLVYERARDELWASTARWLEQGGAIPVDAKLAGELNAPEWIQQISGRVKATDKRDLRSQLGRSPDRADAVTLACWDVPTFRPQRATGQVAPAQEAPPTLDPYTALGAWKR